MDCFLAVTAKHVEQDNALRKVDTLIYWRRPASLGPMRSRMSRT